MQAYILWERAGKPDGADFSGDARRLITESVSSGMTYEQVVRVLGALQGLLCSTRMMLQCKNKLMSSHSTRISVLHTSR